MQLCLALASPLALVLALAQNPTDAQVVTTPEHVRHIPPPAEGSTTAELERKGDELRGLRLFADAIDYYEAALKKQRSAMVYNKLGMAHLAMLRYDEAKKSFERAVKLDKTFPEAHNNVGAVHYAQKNYGKAIKHYRKAIALRADSASFHSNLGTAYFARKEFEKAGAAYAQAIALDPEVFERSSRTGIALRHTSVEDRAHYSFVLAKMFAAHGDSERALNHLRKALEDGFPAKRAREAKEFDQLRVDPRFEELMQAELAVIKDEPTRKNPIRP